MTAMNRARALAALGAVALAGVLVARPDQARAAAPDTIRITLQEHRFTPATISVAAGQRVQIELVNRDKATEEFDSHDLKIEKLVTPNGKVKFWIGPLKPGTYSFMGEFHPATAQGRVVVGEAR
jgi:plastocyanin